MHCLKVNALLVVLLNISELYFYKFLYKPTFVLPSIVTYFTISFVFYISYNIKTNRFQCA